MKRTQNWSAIFLIINLKSHFKRFTFIRFLKITFSLIEIISCFEEKTYRAILSIIVSEVYLSHESQKLFGGTISSQLKCATSKDVLLH